MLKHYYEKYKQFIPLIGIAFVIVVIAVFAVNLVTSDNAVTINEPPVNALEVIEEVEEDAEPAVNISDHVFVEVKGAVKNPGVYEVPVDARVTNVLSLALVSDTADLLTVNQSEKVKDEMVIYVPEIGEVENVNMISAESDSDDEMQVNINTATLEELTQLNGIGEKKAQLILEYREQNGLFMTKEDLMNISGIGEKTFDSLEPYITID
ncbi:helix-hairpin-helix domain-containing protein [Salinicoccus sp. Marseille-QA3877]